MKKRQLRFTGFDDKIVSMYARCMTTRDIQRHLEEMYGVEVSSCVHLVSVLAMEENETWMERKYLNMEQRKTCII